MCGFSLLPADFGHFLDEKVQSITAVPELEQETTNLNTGLIRFFQLFKNINSVLFAIEDRICYTLLRRDCFSAKRLPRPVAADRVFGAGGIQ